MSDLQNKVVLVTGCGRGLGEVTCDVLSAAGATIAAADVRQDAAQAVARRLTERGGRAMPVSLDVGDPKQCAAAVERVTAELGRVDVLINNAGTDRTLPIDELSCEDFDLVVRVNLNGPFYLMKEAFRVMKRQGGGSIVNITSTAAKRAWANASAYHASKWGLLGLSHALHVEGRPHNIKVTAIVAGGMRTPFLLDRFPDLDPNVLQDPRNVAETIRFVLTQPAETVIPEVTVLPMRETSWP